MLEENADTRQAQKKHRKPPHKEKKKQNKNLSLSM